MKKITLSVLVVGLNFTTLFSQTIPSYVPANGLVGWWPFNGNAIDESGNGLNGTVNGSTLTNDRFGNPNMAYSFDGIDDWILINENLNLNIDTGTINFWFNTNMFGEGQLLKMVKYETLENEKFSFKINEGFARLGLKYNSSCQSGIGWNTITDSSILNNNDWHMFTAVIKSDYFHLMIDGLTVSSGISINNAIDNCNSDIQIGRNIINDPDFYNGQIDDIGIWNRTLTQQEITDLFNSGTTGLTNLNIEPKKLIKIIDLNGREINKAKNTVMLYYYSDGSIERVFEID